MEILKQLDAYSDFVWKEAFAVLAIVWIYEGTRVLVSGQSKRRGLKLLLLGVGLVAIMASLSIWMSQSMDMLNNTLSRSYTSELPAGWGPNLTPEEREKNSRSYASVVFVSSGKLISYFDKSGGSLQYCPTTKDVSSRDESVVLNTKLQQLSKDAHESLFGWLVLGSIASILGWFAGRRKNEVV